MYTTTTWSVIPKTDNTQPSNNRGNIMKRFVLATYSDSDDVESIQYVDSHGLGTFVLSNTSAQRLESKQEAIDKLNYLVNTADTGLSPAEVNRLAVVELVPTLVKLEACDSGDA